MLWWLWGLAGTFIYAGPRWVISLFGEPAGRAHTAHCTVELVVALTVGSLAAAAFGPAAATVVLTSLHLKDDNAVAAVIGLFANKLAPALVEKGSSALTSGSDIFNRVLKALKGDEK